MKKHIILDGKSVHEYNSVSNENTLELFDANTEERINPNPVVTIHDTGEVVMVNNVKLLYHEFESILVAMNLFSKDVQKGQWGNFKAIEDVNSIEV